MTRRSLLTARENDDIGLAEQMMLWADVDHLPVMRDANLVGIVSSRDIIQYRSGAEASARRTPVQAIMKTPVETARPDEDVGVAARRMLDKHIGCLPVLENGRLVGMITRTDLLASQPSRAGQMPIPEGLARLVDIMNRRPAVVTEGQDLLMAVDRMLEERVRHLPVVDADNHVVGMLSDYDLRAKFRDPLWQFGEEPPTRGTPAAKVADAMTRDPVLVNQTTSLAVVIRHFIDLRIGALPVIDDNEKLVGLISYLDVLAALYSVRVTDR